MNNKLRKYTNALLQIPKFQCTPMPFHTLVCLLFEYEDTIHVDRVFEQETRHLPVMLVDRLLSQFQRRNRLPYLSSKIVT